MMSSRVEGIARKNGQLSITFPGKYLVLSTVVRRNSRDPFLLE